jgi:RimJ/RimL family protein N-acetyltransferase
VETLTLRETADDDLPSFFEHQTDPAACHMAAFTWKHPLDRATFDAQWAEIRASDRVTMRTILLDGAVAGHIAVFGPPEEREVTYWIDRRHWGKGIATRALSALIRALPERPLLARAAEDNEASLRVLEKCGFVRYGRETFMANARGTEIPEVLLRLDGEGCG